jgi:hypothetical protein
MDTSSTVTIAIRRIRFTNIRRSRLFLQVS